MIIDGLKDSYLLGDSLFRCSGMNGHEVQEGGDFARDIRRLKFETPTRCKIEWELLIHNTLQESLEEVLLWIETHYADLRVKNSKGRQLNVIPQKNLPPDVVEDKARRRLSGKSNVALLVLLGEELPPDSYETLVISFLTSYSSSTYDGRSPSFAMKYRFGLVGYASYLLFRHQLVPEGSYFQIEAPDSYELFVEKTNKPFQEVHRDESSFIMREGPSFVRFQIRVPERVTIWLLLGLLIGLANPFAVIAVYLANPNQLGLLVSIAAGISALLVALRALLFVNVGLLNRLNRWYAAAFAANLVSVLALALVSVTRTLPP